jgi:copper chaperone NosL
MIISDERFAAAVVGPSGESLKFDDIGCLIQHEAGEPRADSTYWVRNYHEPEWLDARRAVFIHERSLNSPMGHNLAALATEEYALGLAAAAKAKLIRLNEISAVVADHNNAETPNQSGPD